MIRPPEQADTGAVAGFFRKLWLPPVPRAAAGSVAVFAGIALTLLLLDEYLVWCLPLFAVLGGAFLVFSGLMDHRHQARHAAAMESVLKRQDDIVLALVEAKRQGRNPVRVLNEQKVHDFDLRERLMKAMEERLQTEGSAESPRKEPEPPATPS